MSQKAENFQAKLQYYAGKVSNNRYLKAVSEGLLTTIPIILVGAIATLLAELNIDSYQNFLTQTGLGGTFELLSSVTMDMMAVYAVFS